jgi:hypothetical protein
MGSFTRKARVRARLANGKSKLIGWLNVYTPNLDHKNSRIIKRGREANRV